MADQGRSNNSHTPEARMSGPNYESQLWGYIYDQMMTQDLPRLLASHLRFYRANLRHIDGPILECACGSGLVLLPLLAAGHDMHGFDISRPMLATLKTKAEAQGIRDIDGRISAQDFESFSYKRLFEAIIVPSNSFVMLATQEAQITALKNIYAHLAPKGMLLLDLRLAGMRGLVEGSVAVQGRWHTWMHPETGRPIRQRVDGRCDFNRQLVQDLCRIEYEGKSEEFPMTARWIFKAEFQLLLRLAGFDHWESFGTPEGAALEFGLDDTHSYWIVYKA
jgi:SAM-dependent methyltransferase